jgi:N-acetylmuramoyl-L-alanine amidase CwlA
MSICRGIAGRRGRNPVGIFIHNDAGGSSMNAAYWANSLANGSHNKEKGFAHAYCGSDGIQQVEDDANCAWHCGNTDGNINYLSIEVCQSMGDLNTFKQSEELALQWCAEKCKQYGITPNENTIRLHQEVFATDCPHRSVEIHGGAAQTKAYFINRIKELMNGNQSTTTDQEGEETMQCMFTVKGKGCVYWMHDGVVTALAHPDELKIIQQIYKDNYGHDMPCYSWSKSAPWHIRLMEPLYREPEKSI